jgi:hypothetical protein
VENSNKIKIVDCDAGRRMGCATFCCRMLVRLQQDEMKPGDGITAAKGFVDKDPEGYCVHVDRKSGFCHNWKNRPKVCREYTCNSDFMLQVVLQEGFVNIAELAKVAARAFIPKETYRYVPTLNDPNSG